MYNDNQDWQIKTNQKGTAKMNLQMSYEFLPGGEEFEEIDDILQA